MLCISIIPLPVHYPVSVTCGSAPRNLRPHEFLTVMAIFCMRSSIRTLDDAPMFRLTGFRPTLLQRLLRLKIKNSIITPDLICGPSCVRYGRTIAQKDRVVVLLLSPSNWRATYFSRLKNVSNEHTHAKPERLF